MMMPYTRIFQWYKLLFSIALVTVLNFAANAQDPAINYDESKMPAYTLPDPLRQSDGKRITRQEQWMKYQRPALLQLFADNVYGRMPGKPGNMRKCRPIQKSCILQYGIRIHLRWMVKLSANNWLYFFHGNLPNPQWRYCFIYQNLQKNLFPFL